VSVSPRAQLYDVSNACLGVLSGMLDVANRIELGQIRAGMVVSCETAREINEIAIARMIEEPTMERFKESIATLTGGSAAVAVILTDGSFGDGERRRLRGGVVEAAPEHHMLCRWGVEAQSPDPDAVYRQFATTDSAAVLEHGVALGARTWDAFLKEMGWAAGDVDRTVCHQVGAGHRDVMLRTVGVSPERDFVSYEFLGNTGTTALPLAAALAEERDFLQAGQRVGLLGIGSGLNCMMLGVDW
jgi:3-oxoacyl-[acyl-carrier-protein] synthase-3